MALLPPLATDSVRVSASTLGLDAHPSLYSFHVDMSSGTEVLTFHGSGPEEVFQKPVLESVEVNRGSIDSSQEESPLPPVRRKRLIRRYTESSSEEDYVPKTFRRKSRVSYRESDSSSDGDSGSMPLPHALSSSKYEGNRKLKLVLELLSESKNIESVLHVGCRIQSWETVPTKSELPIGVLRGCPSCRTCQKVVATWRPDAGRKPCIEDAPSFYPNEEEFQHPLRYIASIRAKAEPYGICRVVPPQSWKPPCPLRGDSAAVRSMEFPTRVQQVHKLQVRQPTATECSPTKQASKKRRGRAPMGRMGGPAVYTPSPPLNDQPEYFGFGHGEPFPLGSFEKYANDFRKQYFRISERQRAGSEHNWEPTVDMIEGEYWRIVEQATDQIEVLYGADVETGNFGSGFPKAEPGSEATTIYENSGWNLNNIARYPGSMLSFEEGDISGVLVPWLYIGMCFSSFCWHVEDHHFYSLNYMHWGAPKIWYGVPGFAAEKLEKAMKKHLPDLFSEQPDLLHKLDVEVVASYAAHGQAECNQVTQLSPSFLKQEGVPVYRLVQQPGDFVITFPNAYHSGFNTGFNVAEAVNVAPVDWLPHGQAAVELYRKLNRKTSVSHDKLLLRAARVAVRMWWHSQHEKSFAETGGPCVSWCAGRDILRDLTGGLEPGLVSSWQAYCGEGGVLAKALKERVNMEQLRRESLKSISGGTLALSMKQMDSTYDSTDERECELCKYDLHLSAVGCVCCPERFVCLLHGHLLCLCPWSKKTLFYRYHPEQLSLLLAAVEGRPGAVANWIKQDVQPTIQSSSSLRNMLSSQDNVPEDDKLKIPHSCTSSTVVEFSTQLNSTTATVEKEPAMRSSYVLAPSSIVPMAEPKILIQPFPNPIISMRNSAASYHNCNAPHHNTSLVCQESKVVSSHPRETVFLKSAARRDAPGQARNEVILLSDDEEEVIICKLNEVGESSFSAHDVPTSRATEYVTGNGLEGRAYQVDSKVDTRNDRYRSPANDLPMQVACGGSSAKRDPLTEASSFAGCNTRQIVPVTAARSPVKEKAVHTLPSGSMHLNPGTERVDERTPFSRPVNDLVTVLQRGTGTSWTPPRVARVRVKREADLLNVGRLVVREGWHTRHAIYPAGFKSHTLFINVEDVFKTCTYVSEIIDRGLGFRPLFQVTHPTKREVYLHESIDGCWHEIQNQINDAIIARRSENSGLQLPPLLPPPNGVEMFGLTSSSVIEAVEALDPFHQCSDYWNAKQHQRPDSAEVKIRRPDVTVGDRLSSALEQAPKPSQDTAAQHRIVNTNSGLSVDIISSTKTAASPPQALVQESPPLRQGTSPSQDTFSTLQGLFQRATSAELRILYRLFANENKGAEFISAFRALTEEVQKRFS